MRAVEKLTLLMAAIVAVLLAPAVVADKTDPYTPSEDVEFYAAFDFDVTMSYATKIILNRAVPVAAIGIVAFIAILIWSCIQCGTDKVDRSDSCHTVMMILGTLSILGCIALIIVVFDADASQQKSIEDVVDLANIFIDWRDAFVNDTIILVDRTNSMINLTAELIDKGGSYLNVSFLNEIAAESNNLLPNAEEIRDALEDTDLAELQEEVRDRGDDVNDIRHIVVLATFITIICLLVIVVGLALCRQYGPESCSDNGCINCVLPFLAGINIFLLLIVWIVAAVLLTVVTVSCDICVDPDTVLLDQADLTNNELAYYFVKCDENTTLTFPYEDDVNVITDGVAEIGPAFDSLQDSFNCTQSQPNCTEVEQLLSDLGDSFDAFRDAVGVTEDGNLTGDGLLYYQTCGSVNGIYQSILNTFCGSFLDAMLLTWKVVISFACLMLLAEIVHKLLAASENEKSLVG